VASVTENTGSEVPVPKGRLDVLAGFLVSARSTKDLQARSTTPRDERDVEEVLDASAPPPTARCYLLHVVEYVQQPLRKDAAGQQPGSRESNRSAPYLFPERSRSN
jgi:hypothetical protein